MRVLLDARVLAAAFTARGLCADVLRAVLSHHELLTARPILRELRGLLSERLGVPRSAADQIVPFVRGQAVLLDTGSDEAYADRRRRAAWLVAQGRPAGVDVVVRAHLRDQDAIASDTPQLTDARGFWRLLSGVP